MRHGIQPRRGALRAPSLRTRGNDEVGAHGCAPCERIRGAGWGAQPCAPTMRIWRHGVARARATRPYEFGAVPQ